MMHAACWVYWSTIDEKPMLLVDKSAIKSDILTTKSRFWAAKICEQATNQKGKVVLNADDALKNGVKIKYERLKIGANCVLLGIGFRQKRRKKECVL